MNIIKYVGILHVGNERDNTHNPLKQRFHAMFSIVHIFHKIGFSFTEHYTRSFSFIGFFLVSVSEGLLISSRKRALHFSSFYEPRSSSPRGKEKRKETATGETGHKGDDHSARVNSDHFFKVLILVDSRWRNFFFVSPSRFCHLLSTFSVRSLLFRRLVGFITDTR